MRKALPVQHPSGAANTILSSCADPSRAVRTCPFTQSIATPSRTACTFPPRRARSTRMDRLPSLCVTLAEKPGHPAGMQGAITRLGTHPRDAGHGSLRCRPGTSSPPPLYTKSSRHARHGAALSRRRPALLTRGVNLLTLGCILCFDLSTRLQPVRTWRSTGHFSCCERS